MDQQKVAPVAGEIEFLTQEEAARLLRKHIQTLQAWRAKGKGPRYFQPGGKGCNVLYLRSDLLAFIAQSEGGAR